MDGWLLAIVGGALIGVATTALLALNGDVAGCGGALARVFHPLAGARAWQALFVAGLVAGGALAYLLWPTSFSTTGPPRSTAALVVGGLLMGVGGRMANGCMSGHCICGLSRRAKRSIVASALFMLFAAGTVLVVRVSSGGAV